MPHGPRMSACWKRQVSQYKHIVNVCFYLFVLAMCFSLVTNYKENISGNETWPNITEIPLRPQTVTHPSKKIIATVTKQLASQIIEPIFLIYVDLGWLRDLHFRYRGLLLVSLGALGLTFGTTQGHHKDHLRPPWRAFETRHQKNTKKQLFGGLFWSPNWMIFLVFFCPCFYTRSERRKWSPDVTKYAEKGCRNYIF